jgi:hypothetical protein
MSGARCRRCSLAAKWSNPASSDRGPRVSYWAACGLYVMKATLAIHATSWVLTILLVINWWSHASKSHLSKSHHLFYILNISPSNLGCICFHGLGWMKMDEMKSSNYLWCLIEKQSSASRMSVIESGVSSSSKKIIDELIPHHSHYWWWLMRMWLHQLSLQLNMRLDEFIPPFHPSNQTWDGINSSLTPGMIPSHRRSTKCTLRFILFPSATMYSLFWSSQTLTSLTTSIPN